MMKYLAMIFSLISMAAFGQDTITESGESSQEVPYYLPSPEGWGTERFPVPVGFAPQIEYTGVEEIRFAPGWVKPESDDYWSYAFLWYLDGDISIDNRIIESNLKDYYTGLIAVNGSNIPTEKLIPVVTDLHEVKPDANDTKTFTGTIEMLDYMSQKAIILNCKVHLAFCKDESKTLLFFELSPKPLTHKIWLSLNKLWHDFKCTMP